MIRSSLQPAEGQENGAPALTPSEAQAHTQAVADVLNSVLASQIQIVDAEKKEDQLKSLIAEPSDSDNGIPICQDSQKKVSVGFQIP